MFHAKLLSACLFMLIATQVCAQVVFVPPGAPLPNFQPGFNYVFPPGYQTPPGGWQVPFNVGIMVGGAAISVGASQMQSIYGAAQDAARAAAASGGTVPNFQFLTPLDGLNVNILHGGVALPGDVGSPTLIQSGSSLMIGSTPPVVGGGSAKPATGADGNKSTESKSGDKDKSTNENEKGRSQDTASPGKPATVEPTASLPTARPTGGGGSSDPVSVVPPEKNAPRDPTPTPKDGKPAEPLVPDQPKLPVDTPRIVMPGVPSPKDPRVVEPTPTGKPRTVVATPNEIRTRDPVAERIDLGLERNIGTTPPIMHRIDNVGVSVPDCMGASREGMACK